MDRAVYKALRLNKNDICEYIIAKRSVDARHKPDIEYVYSVNIISVIHNGKKLDNKSIISNARNKNLAEVKEVSYNFPAVLSPQQTAYFKENEDERPVIVGFGPAGMFAALNLARAGACPVVYERGEPVDKRQQTVENFWNTGVLNRESNVQFGEGGAGTFSDGKLNTGIKDPTGRIRETLKTFVEFGADSNILYVNKPHIGTDVLAEVVKNIRNEIINLGGEINFNTKLNDAIIENNKISSIELVNTVSGEKVLRRCSCLCLALGHSARDTFEMLDKKPLIMEPKPFAVGLRIEHPQEFINYNAYAQAAYNMKETGLPVADYKVTYQTSKKRGVYSFCMCPGGYVVNASSESEMTAVNGMSYSKRDSLNANSAIIVNVTPNDFGNNTLDGMKFQRKLEKLAYKNADGDIPVQLLADFRHNRVSTGLGRVTPCIKGKYKFADLNNVLPQFISEAIKEAVTPEGFGRLIKGFDMEDAVFSGVESRTSSPLRILRDEKLEAAVKGIFPCGEGAGYAGGITSAAVDGIKVAEQIVLSKMHK